MPDSLEFRNKDIVRRALISRIFTCSLILFSSFFNVGLSHRNNSDKCLQVCCISNTPANREYSPVEERGEWGIAAPLIRSNASEHRQSSLVRSSANLGVEPRASSRHSSATTPSTARTSTRSRLTYGEGQCLVTSVVRAGKVTNCTLAPADQ